jgi:ribA/ribD-fused uncharacterized protein
MTNSPITTIDGFFGEYQFLSNFYPSITVSPTVEHHYQAAKTLNPAEQDWILNAKTAGEAKRRGRRITLRPDWDDIKDETMWFFLLLKFASNLTELDKLRATGDAQLTEGNYWHDNYWGSCFCDRCLVVPHHNKLGKMLMRIRSGCYTMET